MRRTDFADFMCERLRGAREARRNKLLRHQPFDCTIKCRGLAWARRRAAGGDWRCDRWLALRARMGRGGVARVLNPAAPVEKKPSPLFQPRPIGSVGLSDRLL